MNKHKERRVPQLRKELRGRRHVLIGKEKAAELKDMLYESDLKLNFNNWRDAPKYSKRTSRFREDPPSKEELQKFRQACFMLLDKGEDDRSHIYGCLTQGEDISELHRADWYRESLVNQLTFHGLNPRKSDTTEYLNEKLYIYAVSKTKDMSLLRRFCYLRDTKVPWERSASYYQKKLIKLILEPKEESGDEESGGEESGGEESGGEESGDEESGGEESGGEESGDEESGDEECEDEEQVDDDGRDEDCTEFEDLSTDLREEEEEEEADDDSRDKGHKDNNRKKKGRKDKDITDEESTDEESTDEGSTDEESEIYRYKVKKGKGYKYITLKKIRGKNIYKAKEESADEESAGEESVKEESVKEESALKERDRLNEMTMAELREACKSQGIKIPRRATKLGLIDLLEKFKENERVKDVKEESADDGIIKEETAEEERDRFDEMTMAELRKVYLLNKFEENKRIKDVKEERADDGGENLIDL